MPQLIYKKLDYPMPELGDLKHRITIYARNIKAPIDASHNYGLDFKSMITVWASIKTLKGDTIFDNVNLDKAISHVMTIRYLPFLTQEHWITYNHKYYDIVRVQDINEQLRFQILYCNLRGDVSKEANKA